MIDLASLGINNRTVAVEFQTFHRFDDLQDIGQFADTGRLDHNVIGMVFVNDHLQCFLEVTLQGAADAAAVDFGHFDARFLKEAAVDTDFTEFIFYKYDVFACKNIFDQFLDQRGLAGAEKSGNNIDLSHI